MVQEIEIRYYDINQLVPFGVGHILNPSLDVIQKRLYLLYPDNKIVLVKWLSYQNVDRFQEEVKNLSRFQDNQHIVRINGLTSTEINGFLWYGIILEYLERKSIFEYYKFFNDYPQFLPEQPTFSNKLNWIKQLCKTLYYLNQKGFLFQKIDVDNILVVDNSQIKLCGFVETYYDPNLSYTPRSNIYFLILTIMKILTGFSRNNNETQDEFCNRCLANISQMCHYKVLFILNNCFRMRNEPFAGNFLNIIEYIEAAYILNNHYTIAQFEEYAIFDDIIFCNCEMPGSVIGELQQYSIKNDPIGAINYLLVIEGPTRVIEEFLLKLIYDEENSSEIIREIFRFSCKNDNLSLINSILSTRNFRQSIDVNTCFESFKESLENNKFETVNIFLNIYQKFTTKYLNYHFSTFCSIGHIFTIDCILSRNGLHIQNLALLRNTMDDITFRKRYFNYYIYLNRKIDEFLLNNNGMMLP